MEQLRECVNAVRTETQKQTTFTHTTVTNQQELEEKVAAIHMCEAGTVQSCVEHF
jgi:hypothetical protein